MRQADFDVICAADIAEGLKRLDEAEISLVILDELLPVDSWRLCQRIDQVFSAKIIFLGSDLTKKPGLALKKSVSISTSRSR